MGGRRGGVFRRSLRQTDGRSHWIGQCGAAHRSIPDALLSNVMPSFLSCAGDGAQHPSHPLPASSFSYGGVAATRFSLGRPFFSPPHLHDDELDLLCAGHCHLISKRVGCREGSPSSAPPPRPIFSLVFGFGIFFFFFFSEIDCSLFGSADRLVCPF